MRVSDTLQALPNATDGRGRLLRF